MGPVGGYEGMGRTPVCDWGIPGGHLGPELEAENLRARTWDGKAHLDILMSQSLDAGGCDLLSRVLQTLHESQGSHFLLIPHTIPSSNCMSGLPVSPRSVELGGGCAAPLDDGGGLVYV